MSSYSVRPATARDAKAIAEIHVAAWQVAYKDVMPADYLKSMTVEKRQAYWREAIEFSEPQLLVATEGDNLDFIISVGYRVKSKQGTQFCNWATMSLLQKRKVMAKNNSQFTTHNSKTERNHLALSTKNCRTFWRPTSGGD